MIFQGAEKKEEMLQRRKKKKTWLHDILGWLSDQIVHSVTALTLFIIPSEGSRGQKDKRGGALRSGVRWLSGSCSPETSFSADSHLVARLRISWVYLWCTTRMIDDREGRSSDAGVSS